MPHDNKLWSRRGLLTNVVGIGIGSGVVSRVASASGSGERFDESEDALGQGLERGNLLPASRSGVVPVKVDKHLPDEEPGSIDINERGTEAFEQGFAQVTTGGRVTGPGRLAMNGTSWLESGWRPREGGRHNVEVAYKHSADYFHRTLDTNGNVTLVSEPNLAVIDDTTGEVVAQKSAVGSGAVTAEATEEVIEMLLTLETGRVQIS